MAWADKHKILYSILSNAMLHTCSNWKFATGMTEEAAVTRLRQGLRRTNNGFLALVTVGDQRRVPVRLPKNNVISKSPHFANNDQCQPTIENLTMTVSTT